MRLRPRRPSRGDRAASSIVVRHPKLILAVWLLLATCGLLCSLHLDDVLTTSFGVPGSESQRGAALVDRSMGVQPETAFTLVIVRRGTHLASMPSLSDTARAAANRAAAVLPEGRAGPIQRYGTNEVFVPVTEGDDEDPARDRTAEVRHAIGHLQGARSYVTGLSAVGHDVRGALASDLARGEFLAFPIAVLVLATVLQSWPALATCVAFALANLTTSLGLVWLVAHRVAIAVYVPNLVTLIGLGISLDYSMLLISRFREELAISGDPRRAVERTMRTAGRTTRYAGLAVALGLAALTTVPVSLVRSLGAGSMLVPLISILACATLLPAILVTLGDRIDALPIAPGLSRAHPINGDKRWRQLAAAVMRRPMTFIVLASVIMGALAAPVAQLALTGGDTRGLPADTESVQGLHLVSAALGAGVVSPYQIVVDTGHAGGAFTAAALDGQRRLLTAAYRDPAVQPGSTLAPAIIHPRPGRPSHREMAEMRQSNLVDARGRVLQVYAIGRTDIGTPEATQFVDRLRHQIIPRAHLPGTTAVTGGAAVNLDVTSRVYGAFPQYLLILLALCVPMLAVALRSIVLPIKAVLMNALTVVSTFGVLVLAFQHGWGEPFGLIQTPQIDATVPIFLFAVLYGLSMDYEIFLLFRTREAWEGGATNTEAVAEGLVNSGRIITAAAMIMATAFLGLSIGRFVALQEIGVGLAVAVLIDATIIRILLVPALMRVLGHLNWWLPRRRSSRDRLTAT
jgi:RND superfamily putative drug exporter